MTGNYYNGFSPAERGGYARANQAARAIADLPEPLFCSVCVGRPPHPMGWHSEDYRTPLGEHPICRRCHYAIHIRFKRPSYWLRYISQFDADGWFQHLTLDPASLHRPYEETYPDGQLPHRLLRVRHRSPEGKGGSDCTTR